jgi:peptide/nickel transport system permease protein
LIPGLFLIVIVISINLLGDFLRDVFNPRLYKD